MNGNAISWSSAGKLKLRGSRKSTPFAAQMVSEDAAKVAYDQGMRSVEVINQLLIAVRGEGRLVGLSIHGPDSDHNRLAGHVLRGARGFRTGIGVVSVVRGFFCAAGSKQTNDHHNSQQQRKNLFHYGSS